MGGIQPLGTVSVLFKRVAKLMKAAVDRYIDFVDYVVSPQEQPKTLGSPTLPLFPEEQKSEGKKRVFPRQSVALDGEITVGFAGIPETIQVGNINEHGIYFTANRRVGIGEVMTVLVTLPAEFSSSGAPERVAYRIKVRRVEPLATEGNFGVAASVTGRRLL